MTSQVVKCVPAVKRTYMLGVKFLSPLGGNMGRKQIILRGPNEGMVSGIKRFDPMCKLLWCSIPVRPLMTCHYPDLGSASDWLMLIFSQSEALPTPGK